MRKKLFYKYCLSLGFGVAVALLGHSNLMASDNPMDPEAPFYRALSAKFRIDFDGSAKSKEDLIEAAGKLRELKLSWKGITMIPEAIGCLVHLRSIYLLHNELQTLPKSIGNLVNLRVLNITNNELQKLPDSVGELLKLEKLVLWYNKLTVLPESIGNLVNLRVLNLYKNELETLPESIGNLVNLTGLRLDDNNLETLPESIGKLVKLEFIKLSGNKITVLPDSIGNLVKLKELLLWSNKLTVLPDSIGNLTQLTHFLVNDNPLNLQSKMLVCGLVINDNDFGQFYFDLMALDNARFKEIFYQVYGDPTEVIELVNKTLPQPIAEEIVPEIFRPGPDADKINKRLQEIAIRKGIPAEFFMEQ